MKIDCRRMSTGSALLAFLLPLVLFLAFGAFAPAGAQDDDEEEDGTVRKYVGAKTCAGFCHKTAKQGEQFAKWEASAHSKAYETLGTEKAREVAKKMGVEDPQKSEKCLVCHTTAPDAPDELKGAKFSNTEGVGCERCHGAGSLYKKRSIMKDRDAAVAAGLLIPDKATCLQCHNEKNPTHKGFNYEESLKKIAHPAPE